MDSVDRSKKSTTTNTSSAREGTSNGGVGGHQESDSNATASTVAAVGIAAGVIAAGASLLWTLFGPSDSSSEGETMKAPGRDERILRRDFENDPKGYFRDLRKK